MVPVTIAAVNLSNPKFVRAGDVIQDMASATKIVRCWLKEGGGGIYVGEA